MDLIENGMASLAGKIKAYMSLPFTYTAGASHATIQARRMPKPPMQVDRGNGHLTEIQPCDFEMSTADLPFGLPARGHTLDDGTHFYTVQPYNGEKCFYEPNASMIRIFTVLSK